MSKYTKVTIDRRRKPVLDAFVEKIELNERGCWIWKGAKNKGYGTLKVAGRTCLATRVAYDMFIGDIPKGLTTDHVICRIPACVNPNHLRLLSLSANSADNRWANQFRNTTHCPRGHPYDETNTYVRTLPTGKKGRTCIECMRIAQLKAKHKRDGKPMETFVANPRVFKFLHRPKPILS